MAPGPPDEESNSPNFSSYPPIFVLPTHLDLDTLHQLEDRLTQRGARLTYDVEEARLFLGSIGQKKRAALELRSRGLYTEEDDEDSSDAPGVKRVKTASTAGSYTTTTSQSDGIQLVKLEWLDRCLEERQLLPIDPFIVYRAHRIERPDTKVNSKDAAVKGILERAKQDVHPESTTATPPPKYISRHSREPRHGPPTLHRTTTSEDDNNDTQAPLPPTPDWVKNNILFACQRSAPLHPPNDTFITQLTKIRTIRSLTLDEIGVRAYSTSIASVAAYPYTFRRASEVLSLPGCDLKIANLFSEFQHSEHGTLAAADALDTDPTLSTLHHFAQIWGVGPKTARDFYYTRHWRDLDDIVEHGWHSLTRVQQIGVKYYDEFLDRVPRSEVDEIARVVRNHANSVRPDARYDGRGVECVIVGGYRRGKESSGDVDLILTHRDEAVTLDLVEDVVASLETEGWITHTLTLHMMNSHRGQQTLPFRGDSSAPEARRHFDTLDKALVVWQDPHFEDDESKPPHEVSNDQAVPITEGQEEEERETKKERERALKRKRNPNPPRRVDIIVSPWRTIGCAVLGWTGDTTFERDLRRYAKKAHGWKFDSSGVRERTSGGGVLDLEGGGETWEERERLVMERLGVGWREPGMRCSR